MDIVIGRHVDTCSQPRVSNKTESLLPGFKGLSINSYAGLCAAFSALGGMILGYEHVFQLHISSHELIAFLVRELSP